MARADLAIGASGTASWERCCLGLPAILVTLADNQVGVAKALKKYGACLYLGDKKNITTQALGTALESLLDNQKSLEKMSVQAYRLVDGLGSKRITKQICATGSNDYNQSET
jgi:spore coat polysaccharide biosynthesis predicted glycosyltransferase SpsG